VIKEKKTTKKVTLDSSVIVAYLLKGDKNNAEASLIWEQIAKNYIEVIIPVTVLIEISAAIRRRTELKELSKDIYSSLLKIPSINFIDLDIFRSRKTVDIAAEFGLRGMDAIVVQVSKEFGTELITFDKEMLNRVYTK
jgi:predicted nucleic acid-binding protein